MSELLFLREDDAVITAEVVPSGDGFVADTWVSLLYRNGPVAVAHLTLAVLGDNEAWASQRTRFILSDILQMSLKLAGGYGAPHVEGSAPVEHAQLHMEQHYRRIEELFETPLEETVALYELLSSFHIHNPAVLIAEQMGVKSVRTVHDRLATARKQGLLTTYGRGRSHA